MKILDNATNLKWPPTYQIRRHPRARHIRLKISSGGLLEITLPRTVPMREIPAILEKHKHWITKHVLPVSQSYQDLPQAIFFGFNQQRWSVEYVADAKQPTRLQTYCEKQKLIVSGGHQSYATIAALLQGWAKKQAKQMLPILLQSLSRAMHLSYQKVTVRDQATRWGSCSLAGTISLNYKLIFLPQVLSQYVLIHELCHLKHMNHSKAFWDLVEKYDPQWRMHVRELKNVKEFIPLWTCK